MVVKILKRWLPALIIMAFIFVSSSLPGATVSSNGDVDFLAHKLVHFVLYAILTLAFFRATKNIPLSVLLAILYGISDEIHQTYVPTRSGNPQDVLVDSLGAITSGLVLWKSMHLLPKPLKNWLSE